MSSTIDWHTLSGKQIQVFLQALLHAFPQRDSLALMLRLNMETTLDHVVSSSNMQDATFQLIEWSQAAGRTQELYASALAGAPDNPILKGLEAKLEALASGASSANPIASAAPTTQTTAGSSDNISVTVGNDNSNVIVGKDITVHNYPAEDGPSANDDGTDPTSINSPALDMWRKKLAYLLTQEAIVVDAAQKFAIAEQIEEAKQKIHELS